MAYGGHRRERKSFEPPPWEREQFGAKAERERTRSVEPAAAEEPLAIESEEPAIVTTARAPAPDPNAESADGVEPEARFNVMLDSLRYEESASTAATDHIAVWGSLVVAIFGVVLFVWAVVGLVVGGGKTLAFALAMVLMCMGAFFAAIGAWFMAKSLKRQGVL